MEIANSDSLKEQVLKSLAWLGFMKYLGQFVTWGITIWVMRLLMPSDYGLMAMAFVFIGFLAMVSELGLGAVIVQKNDINQVQLSQLFGIAIVSLGIMFILVFLGAPLFSAFFSEPSLVPILRILSINLILMSFYVVPQALIIRDMNFKVKSIIDLLSAIASSGITLILALKGFGVWALVWGAVAIHISLTIAYNVVGMHFLPNFSFKNVKNLFYFGGFLTGSRLLWYFYSQADILIGGRYLTSEALGSYSVAHELSGMPVEKIMPIITQVAFPAYSRIQKDLNLVQSHFIKSVRVISSVIFPAVWGLLIVAPELIPLLLSKKWNGIILPFQLLCIIMPLRGVNSLFAPVLLGLGRVRVHFANVTIASIFMTICIFIGVHWGIIGICLSWVFGFLFVFPVILKRTLNALELPIKNFFLAIYTPIIASLLMMASIFLLKYWFKDLLSILMITVISVFWGMTIYTISIYFINRELFEELLGVLSFLKNRKQSTISEN